MREFLGNPTSIHRLTNHISVSIKTSSAILAKPLPDSATVLCLGQCNSRHLKFCGIMKSTCYSQTNWISYNLNWDIHMLTRSAPLQNEMVASGNRARSSVGRSLSMLSVALVPCVVVSFLFYISILAFSVAFTVPHEHFLAAILMQFTSTTLFFFYLELQSD